MTRHIVIRRPFASYVFFVRAFYWWWCGGRELGGGGRGNWSSEIWSVQFMSPSSQSNENEKWTSHGRPATMPRASWIHKPLVIWCLVSWFTGYLHRFLAINSINLSICPASCGHHTNIRSLTWFDWRQSMFQHMCKILQYCFQKHWNLLSIAQIKMLPHKLRWKFRVFIFL